MVHEWCLCIVFLTPCVICICIVQCSLKATPPVASISVQAQADLKHDWGDRVEVEADLKPEPKPANITKPRMSLCGCCFERLLYLLKN